MNSLTELIFEDVIVERGSRSTDYGWGKYGDFKVLIRKKDGYINATKLCKDGGKELKHWRESKTSQEMVKEFTLEVGIPTANLLETVDGQYLKKS